ncbi:hypothetical protein [Candidatus Symbiothrix dinenymphae]|uniref:hypothetical protein n=1 Tax=Candidatus Symbiothrix dinenymphae TaxID=467085 RepID=UPI000AF3B128|nr:hypothetical protein [Candidatus Symbiothrix dinenymphae]
MPNDGIENITSLFNEIQPLEVRRLYLACDYSALNDDAKKQIKAIIADVNWDCQVNTMYNKTNLGYDKTMLKAVKP